MLKAPPSRGRTVGRRGFNILEVVVALGILSVAALAVVGILPSMSKLSLDSKDTMQCVYLATQKMDQLASVSVPNSGSDFAAWNSSTAYGTGTAVTMAGDYYYVSLQNSTDVEPPNSTYWQSLGVYPHNLSRTWTCTLDAQDITLEDIVVTVTWQEPSRSSQSWITHSFSVYGLMAP